MCVPRWPIYHPLCALLMRWVQLRARFVPYMCNHCYSCLRAACVVPQLAETPWRLTVASGNPTCGPPVAYVPVDQFAQQVCTWSYSLSLCPVGQVSGGVTGGSRKMGGIPRFSNGWLTGARCLCSWRMSTFKPARALFCAARISAGYNYSDIIMNRLASLEP